MTFRRFVAHDAVGAVLSLAELVAAGFLLGTTYEQAGLGFALAGGVLFVAALALFGRRLARDTAA